MFEWMVYHEFYRRGGRPETGGCSHTAAVFRCTIVTSNIQRLTLKKESFSTQSVIQEIGEGKLVTRSQVTKCLSNDKTGNTRDN
jgi:hypothetical protein